MLIHRQKGLELYRRNGGIFAVAHKRDGEERYNHIHHCIHNVAEKLRILKDSGFTPKLLKEKANSIWMEDLGESDGFEGWNISEWEDWRRKLVKCHIKLRQKRIRHGDLNGNNIELEFEPSSDDTGSGLIITATVDANATGVGAALHMAADGNYEEADADATTTAPCTAIALETGTGSKKVLLHGIIRNDGWNWTKGPGEAGLIYLSTTTGALTQTAPSGSGDQVQVVGHALSDDVMYFNPQLHVVEVA